MIHIDPVLIISLGFALGLLTATWIYIFIQTIRERRNNPLRFTREPSRDASRDRTLPGKQRIKQRRSRSW